MCILTLNFLIGLKRKLSMFYCCPDCDSIAYKKNGYTRHGKQNHRCLDCGRQFSIELEEEEEFAQLHEVQSTAEY